MSEPLQVSPRQWIEARRWLEFVDEDLRAAQMLVNASPPAIRSAAFHGQQAAEKLAKAVLVAMSVDIPKTHDLTELSRLVSEVEPNIGRAFAAMTNLTDWYIAARYVDAEIDIVPSEQDVRSALVRLQDLRRRVVAMAPSA